ncbi:uncharacterized protein LOC106063032 [Biomphalaria glabrata]|uniref:Uncharacterized protein LOC106063032 n=2 Tax=Biomphalaria glabrata TaxID=6526 RepID=A0A9W2YJK2_BIOGL|nr:uncharacterized protein LOC106063032 [Biomphalaria glabrata]
MISLCDRVYGAVCFSLWASLLLDLALLTKGQFYLLEDTQRNYSDAVMKCKSLGYDGLAVVDTKQSLDTVLKQLRYPAKEQYWIGMHYSVKKKYHIWDTGVDVTWAAWNTGEPDNMPTDKCVRIRTTLNFGTWTCSALFMAVCGRYSSVYNEMLLETRQHITFSDPLWSGWARSLLDCAARCTTDLRCQYSLYGSADLTCVTLSKNYNGSRVGSQQMLNGVMVAKDDVNLS